MKRKSDNAEIHPVNGIGPGTVNIRDLIVQRDQQRRRERKRELEREIQRARVTAEAHGIFEGRMRQIVEDDARVIREPDVLTGFAIVSEPVSDTIVAH